MKTLKVYDSDLSIIIDGLKKELQSFEDEKEGTNNQIFLITHIRRIKDLLSRCEELEAKPDFKILNA